MLTKLSQLQDLAKKSQKKKLALAAAHDDNALEAVVNAAKAGIVEPILVGIETKINQIAKDRNFDIKGMRIINESDPDKIAEIAVKLVKNKEAEILMKGNVGTPTLLKAVLNKEWGLRSGALISHLALFEMPTYHKIIALADAAMNVAPDFNAKVGIVNNSVDYLRKLGIEKPKVAVLGATELVNPDQPATIDAAMLSKMADRNQIKNCIIDGPFALDNAISHESAHHKGIESNVAGEADLLLAADIEAANGLYKAFIFLANAKCAAVIIGAAAPIVLTSRADSDETKLASIAMAAAIN